MPRHGEATAFPARRGMTARFLSAGDRALVVEFGDRIDRALNDEVLRRIERELDLTESRIAALPNP